MGNDLENILRAAKTALGMFFVSKAKRKWLRCSGTGGKTTVTAPRGTVTTTACDASNRIAQTSIANTAELLYNYSNGTLSSVSRTVATGTQTYNFSCDGNA